MIIVYLYIEKMRKIVEPLKKKTPWVRARSILQVLEQKRGKTYPSCIVNRRSRILLSIRVCIYIDTFLLGNTRTQFAPTTTYSRG
jgi:hypothetical protein